MMHNREQLLELCCQVRTIMNEEAAVLLPDCPIQEYKELKEEDGIPHLGRCHINYTEWSSGRFSQTSIASETTLIEISLTHPHTAESLPVAAVISILIHEFAHSITPIRRYRSADTWTIYDGHGIDFRIQYATLLKVAEKKGILCFPAIQGKYSRKFLSRLDSLEVIGSSPRFHTQPLTTSERRCQPKKDLYRITIVNSKNIRKLVSIPVCEHRTAAHLLVLAKSKFQHRYSKVALLDGTILSNLSTLDSLCKESSELCVLVL